MIGVFDEGVVVAATLAFISADPAALSSTSPIISFMSRKLTIDLPSASFHMIEMEPSPLTSVMMQAGISAEVCPPGHWTPHPFHPLEDPHTVNSNSKHTVVSTGGETENGKRERDGGGFTKRDRRRLAPWRASAAF